MLMPIRLSDPEHVSRSLERRNIRGLVSRVSDNEKDIDNRLSHQPRHAGRSNMLHHDRTLTQSSVDPLRFTRKILGPYPVVLYERNGGVEGLELTNSRLPDLFVGHQWRGLLRVC